LKPRSPAKPPSTRLRISDLRGLAQLATQAVLGVSDIVEGVHQSVWSSLGVPGGERPGRTRGITGWVYRGVNGTTRLFGRGVDAGLHGLQSLLSPDDAHPADGRQRDALVAALNGVMGDRLLASGNPLAITMSLRHEGRALDPFDLPDSLRGKARGRIVLLIHGLCMNDLQWTRPGQQDPGRLHDHGRALGDALGCTPIYLRYNSGLHVALNGQLLAALLEPLLQHWPVPVKELIIVGHSMGGLVARSAVHNAQAARLHWPGRLSSIIFLGTPHHGAPLERAGSWVDAALGSTRYTAPFAALGQLRSAGITDLRHGQVLDVQGPERFAHRNDRRRPLALPAGVACYAIAATTAEQRSPAADHLTGDGLVPVRSALGEHAQALHTLAFAPSRQWIAYRTNHMELLGSEAVARKMIEWLRRPGD
jgi:pimeloyl-ACP methyl ester carboxylesterase